jgi:hAT family C-terminal dimerisation region
MQRRRTEWLFKVFAKITSYRSIFGSFFEQQYFVRIRHLVYLRSQCPSFIPSLALDNPAAWGRTLFVCGYSTSRAARITADKFLSSLQSSSSCQRRPVDDVILHMQEPVPNVNTNPLQWWQLNGSRYPRLFNLHIKYLGPPATSNTAEKVASKVSEIVSQSETMHCGRVSVIVKICQLPTRNKWPKRIYSWADCRGNVEGIILIIKCLVCCSTL